MLSKILREPRELPWQPNLSKIKQNWTDFSFVQNMETIFVQDTVQDTETMLACMGGFSRSGN